MPPSPTSARRSRHVLASPSPRRCTLRQITDSPPLVYPGVGGEARHRRAAVARCAENSAVHRPDVRWLLTGPARLPAALAGHLADRTRATFRARVSGDPSGTPDWVHDIADRGQGQGWFEPDGVVWAVHGDLSTIVGGVAALLGQATHPLALAGVEGHSAYRDDPWKRLAGTARWLVVTTFGSAELAEREAARVRGMHRTVTGAAQDGRRYAASDPALLRWVHLAFTDAFLHAQLVVGADLTSRFGPRWPDAYVADWARSAQAGRRYAASDPALLRWVHLAFTDAFLHAQLLVGADLT
ncbi:MAG: DUF2236 domain-containing protein, partial [Rhodoferax sp.]|nr:DUF2236 domain-containing protein [Actinomycetota bacterium]